MTQLTLIGVLCWLTPTLENSPLLHVPGLSSALAGDLCSFAPLSPLSCNSRPAHVADLLSSRDSGLAKIKLRTVTRGILQCYSKLTSVS